MTDKQDKPGLHTTRKSAGYFMIQHVKSVFEIDAIKFTLFLTTMVRVVILNNDTFCLMNCNRVIKLEHKMNLWFAGIWNLACWVQKYADNVLKNFSQFSQKVDSGISCKSP